MHARLQGAMEGVAGRHGRQGRSDDNKGPAESTGH